MCSVRRSRTCKSAVFVALGSAIFLGTPTQAEDMTAGIVAERMNPQQFSAYVAGIVEGLVHADAANDDADCIYAWFYDSENRLGQVEATFAHYRDHFPGAVVAAMVRKECGP